MTVVETPQTRCLAAMTRCDITPPVGIYHRMWGAATHDRATGVHRPLTATLLWLEPPEGDLQQALAIVSLDHCILDEADLRPMQQAVAQATAISPNRVLIALTHTHAAGLMSRTRANLPGGDLIGPYLDDVAARLSTLARQARDNKTAATILYGTGRCNLAAQRDFFDEQRKQVVCGLNPAGEADDTLLVAKIVAEGGQLLGTVVNYACHPTTLAWDNTAISPDYLGALREVVETPTGAPCLFLQGASGDLGPREGFVGDHAVADRNGRQLGFAVLATLESLPAPGTCFAYQGPVVSGATIGTWRHEPVEAAALARQARWTISQATAALPYRDGLPTAEQTERERAQLQAEEAEALAAGQTERARDCHARVEQMTRQLWRLAALPLGKTFPLTADVAALGDALWLFVPGEHYQALQTTLRARFPATPCLVATIAGGWQPGYIPAAGAYGRGIYQEQIAVVACGSAELLLETLTREIAALGVQS